MVEWLAPLGTSLPPKAAPTDAHFDSPEVYRVAGECWQLIGKQRNVVGEPVGKLARALPLAEKWAAESAKCTGPRAGGSQLRAEG